MEVLRVDPHSPVQKPKSYLAFRENTSDSEGRAAAPADLPNRVEKVQSASAASPEGLKVRQEGGSSPLSSEQVEREVAEINTILAKMGHREIHLSLDEESGDVVIQVVDSESEEVVRQIPPEHVLELRDRLAEMKGILINEEG